MKIHDTHDDAIIEIVHDFKKRYVELQKQISDETEKDNIKEILSPNWEQEVLSNKNNRKMK